MADLDPIRRNLTAALARRDAQVRGLAEIAGRLAAERARLEAAQAAGDTEQIAAATAKIWDLGVQRASAARAIGRVHEELRAGLDAQLGSLLRLEGDTPLALLPVRIEARSTPGGTSLRVRIFHDALHTESLDEGLSDSERAAGLEYWSVVWRDGDSQAPWSGLIAAVGRNRAPWVAEALRPRNLALRPAGNPDFPDTTPRSGRPAVARTLPDRFYVRLEQEGAAAVTVHGATIPDELPVGLTDRDELTALQIEGEDLPPIDNSLRWLVDYAEAERLGMAVTVPLPVPGRTVRRLLVYGVRASLDPAAGAKRMANLIRSHRFTDGAEFVAQGTPTNNTESARTAWSRRTPPGPPDLAPGNPLDAGVNAAVTARALGLPPEALAALPNARDAEQTRAAAFNTALWTTTWGDAIEHLTPKGRSNGDERLDSPALDAVREHWIANVRGRGPAPVLRLGRQPYGLLPLVNTDAAWRPRRSGFVENRLVPFIDGQIRWMWRDGEANVPTIMNRALDVALPEILGTDAVLRGLRVRTALSPDPIMAAATALLLPDLGGTSGPDVTRALLVLSGVADDALDSHDILAGKTRPLALALVDDTDLAFVANLLAPAPAKMKPKSVLQVLLAHAAAVEEHARDSVAAPETRAFLRESIAARADVDQALVIGALESTLGPERTDDGLVAKAAEHVTAQVGRLDLRMVADRHPFAALAPPTTLQQLAGTTPEHSRLTGDAGLQLVGEIFHRSRRAAEFRAALQVIGAITSLEERRLLLSETLDCCSHRLDAWITAAAALRLDQMRSDAPQGLLLGAYGWLENLALRVPAAAGQIDGRNVLHDGADGGFIHTPGLTHAATAAVLRSGRLTHRSGDPNSTAMDIDLSSTRVRDALALLDGMRQGQSLGALLGYRLERRLHEMSGNGLELDRFIYVLRALAPLRGGKLTEPNAPVQESLAASDVVDGLRLMEIAEGVVRQKLEDGPADPHYIVLPDRWVGPSPREADAVVAAIADLERTHDAVADLLLAESVHQLVSGNAARAAATLDALGAGESTPPEPEVVRTPRAGVSIQHRLAIVVPDPLATRQSGWNTIAPRARAEPSLEIWAQGALGDPASLRIAEGSDARIAQARLCALDVIYDADGGSVATSTLAARLRAAIPDLGADLKPLAPIWELSGLLRAALVAGRALVASDLGPPIDANATGRIADAAELLARAHTAVDTLRAIAMNPAPEAQLAGFGIWPAATAPGGAAASTTVQTLINQATARVVAATALLARAVPPAPPKTIIELAGQALAQAFGGNFLALPILLPPPPTETDLWTGALGPAGVRPRPGADIRPWLSRVGTIRNAASAYGETLLVREALDRRPLLRGVQFPASAFATWAGLPFPDGRPPMTPLTSFVAEVAGAQAGDPEPKLDQALAGVVLDEWIEAVPRRLERRDPANPDDPAELVDVTTTGLAVNANAPGARPPQAILLALSADGGDWTGDRLVHALDEALTLAKMRTITLQQLPYAGRQLPALYFRDWSLQGEPVIDWSIVAEDFATANVQRFLSVDK